MRVGHSCHTLLQQHLLPRPSFVHSSFFISKKENRKPTNISGLQEERIRLGSICPCRNVKYLQNQIIVCNFAVVRYGLIYYHLIVL